ncbi:MAG: hypothetical protein AMJ68_02840 [Acidithiobacillales bacterium SG8_45]|jgi:uncharacterized protein (DUF2062 family)|nr:MAG: hypothetical protein AMJ68_02840 [Acidithiobacillales bacterium SG8_45]
MNAKDDKLLADARTALNRKAETLDDAVLVELRAARLAATQAADRSRRSGSWLSPIPGTGSSWVLSRTMGGMVAVTLVLAVAMTVWLANPVVPRGDLEDLEILAANESPEFYQDLDFYLWLESGSTRAG